MDGSGEKLRVGVIGATGYGGMELVRLLLGHPHVSLTYVTSETFQGQPLGEVLPHFRGFTNLTLHSFDPTYATNSRDLLFLAWQPGRAMEVAPELLKHGVRIIDLSADYRLKSADLYERVYKQRHASPKLLAEAAYGIPELWGDAVKTARVVACPGCYPTGALLGLAPLLSEGVIDPADVIVNAASGVSGAGRSKFELGFHFPEMDENYRPYNVTGHRHRPEIEQQMTALCGEEARIVFAPHLVPMARGELCTVYCRLTRPITPEEAQGAFERFYSGRPFVQVLPQGQLPATKNVLGTNMCHLGVAVDTHANRVIVMSAVDNLVRGTAGQAVQNMNLMFGFPETAGLMLPGQYP
ncbi:MAG: N-acetyl-gamma-glutamyl-phosphate reductase [Armatimonadetes bacterium]|nr:N-acetyl-gamma-glutamyl-phosphate reductase [Armatimonadota bacterium]